MTTTPQTPPPDGLAPELGSAPYAVQVSKTAEWEWARGKCLQGPRDAKTVKRDGYALTDDPKEAWPFKTLDGAKLKARIYARHMTMPESDVVVISLNTQALAREALPAESGSHLE